MRIANLTILFTVLFACAAVSEAQSLGSVAKKERERRDKNKKEGVASREFTQEEVSGKEEAEAEEPAGAEGSTSGEAKEDTEASGAKPSPFPGRIEVDLKGEASDPAHAESDRKKSEAQWRARVSSARARIVAARESVQALEGLALPQGGYYVDAEGKVVIESLEHLQRLVREAKDELAAAEKALKDLQEEARQSGVPPGWLR